MLIMTRRVCTDGVIVAPAILLNNVVDVSSQKQSEARKMCFEAPLIGWNN
jgi:hypothetical protein